MVGPSVVDRVMCPSAVLVSTGGDEAGRSSEVAPDVQGKIEGPLEMPGGSMVEIPKYVGGVVGVAEAP